MAAAMVTAGCTAALLVTVGGAAASGSVSQSRTSAGQLATARLERSTGAMQGDSSRAGTSIALGGLAGVPVANPRTGTVYVPVSSGHVVAVINAATCNATVRSVGVAVNPYTDTVYVTDLFQAGALSIFKTAR
jgi:DNA-binding beta-propeller fold protein YncE